MIDKNIKNPYGGNYDPQVGGRLLDNYKNGVYEKAGKKLSSKGVAAIIGYAKEYNVELPDEFKPSYTPKKIATPEPTPDVSTEPTFKEKFGSFFDSIKNNVPETPQDRSFAGIGGGPPKYEKTSDQSSILADTITERYAQYAGQTENVPQSQQPQQPQQSQAPQPTMNQFTTEDIKAQTENPQLSSTVSNFAIENKRIDVTKIPKDKSEVANITMGYNQKQSVLDTAKQTFVFYDLATNQAKEYFKEMNGEENRAAEMEKELIQMAQEHPEMFDKENVPLIKEMFLQSVSMAPFMKNVILNGIEKGLVGAMAAGGMAALLGQAGPQIATAEEIVTVPIAATAGFKTGRVVGNFEESFRTEAGFAYKDMTEQGMDPTVASKIATVVGLANAGIELAQVGRILKKFPIIGKVLKSGITDATMETAKKYVKKSAGKIFLNGLKEFSKDIAIETGQEIAQEIVPIVGEIAGKKISGDTTAKWSDVANKENRDRIAEVTTSTLKGMPGILLFGNVSSVGGEYYNNYQSEKVTSDINDSVGTVMAVANNPKYSTENKVDILDRNIAELKKVSNITGYEEVQNKAKESYTELEKTKAQVQFREVLNTVMNKENKSEIEDSEFIAYENAKETLGILKDKDSKTKEEIAIVETYSELIKDFDNLIDTNKKPVNIEEKVQFMDDLDKNIATKALELYENSRETLTADAIGMPKIAAVIQRKDSDAKLKINDREIPVSIESIEYDGEGTVYAKLKGSNKFVDMKNIIAPPTEQGKKEGFKSLRDELIVRYESELQNVSKRRDLLNNLSEKESIELFKNIVKGDIEAKDYGIDKEYAKKKLAEFNEKEETKKTEDKTETKEIKKTEEAETKKETTEETQETKYEKITQAMKKDITDDVRDAFDNAEGYVQDYLANHAEEFGIEGNQTDLDELTSRIEDTFNEGEVSKETVDATEAEFDEAMEKVAKEEEEVTDENKTYRYYTTLRPPSPGAIPKGFTNVEMYDNKTDGSWGYVEYDKPLSTKQISDYELREEIIDKEEVETPVEETKSEPSFGYHAGDLGKAERYVNFFGSKRGTGHFGTGTYFVSSAEKIKSEDYSNRPQHKIDLLGYNLYKPLNDTEARILHDDILRFVNDNMYNLLNKYETEEPNTNDIDELGFEEPNEQINILKKYDIYDSTEFENRVGMTYEKFDKESRKKGFKWNKYNRYIDNKIRDLKAITSDIGDYKNGKTLFKEGISKYLDISLEDAEKILEQIKTDLKTKGFTEETSYYNAPKEILKGDSFSTRFMKKLGYEGVDVRHIDRYDNTQYGSVIYDLKTKDQEAVDETAEAEPMETVEPEDVTPTEPEETAETEEIIDEDIASHLDNEKAKAIYENTLGREGEVRFVTKQKALSKELSVKMIERKFGKNSLKKEDLIVPSSSNFGYTSSMKHSIVEALLEPEKISTATIEGNKIKIKVPNDGTLNVVNTPKAKTKMLEMLNVKHIAPNVSVITKKAIPITKGSHVVSADIIDSNYTMLYGQGSSYALFLNNREFNNVFDYMMEMEKVKKDYYFGLKGSNMAKETTQDLVGQTGQPITEMLYIPKEKSVYVKTENSSYREMDLTYIKKFDRKNINFYKTEDKNSKLYITDEDGKPLGLIMPKSKNFETKQGLEEEIGKMSTYPLKGNMPTESAILDFEFEAEPETIVEKKETAKETEVEKPTEKVEVSEEAYKFTKRELKEIKTAGQAAYNKIAKTEAGRGSKDYYRTKAHVLEIAKIGREEAKEVKREQIKKRHRNEGIDTSPKKDLDDYGKYAELQKQWLTDIGQRGLKYQIASDYIYTNIDQIKNDLDKGRITKEEVIAVMKDAEKSGAFSKEELEFKNEQISKVIETRAEEIVDEIDTEINININDIDKETASRAFSGVSFDPEERGQKVREDYVTTLQGIWEKAKEFGKTEEQKDALVEEFDKFQKQYITLLNDYLNTYNGFYSTMISGASNYPTAKMEKLRNRIEDKYRKIIDFEEAGIKRIEKNVFNVLSDEEKGSSEFNEHWTAIERDFNSVKNAKEKNLPNYVKTNAKQRAESRIKRIFNNGDKEAARELLNKLDEIQKENKIYLFTKRHSIWKLLNEQVKSRDEAVGEFDEISTDIVTASINDKNKLVLDFGDAETYKSIDEKLQGQIKRLFNYSRTQGWVSKGLWRNNSFNYKVILKDLGIDLKKEKSKKSLEDYDIRITFNGVNDPVATENIIDTLADIERMNYGEDELYNYSRGSASRTLDKLANEGFKDEVNQAREKIDISEMDIEQLREFRSYLTNKEFKDLTTKEIELIPDIEGKINKLSPDTLKARITNDFADKESGHIMTKTYEKLSEVENVDEFLRDTLRRTFGEGMVGDYNAKRRQKLMSSLKGQSVPQAKSGVTALEAEVRKYFSGKFKSEKPQNETYMYPNGFDKKEITESEIKHMDNNMIQRGKPDVYDGLGYNKPDYTQAMMGSDDLIIMATRLMKYSDTQLNVDRKFFENFIEKNGGSDDVVKTENIKDNVTKEPVVAKETKTDLTLKDGVDGVYTEVNKDGSISVDFEYDFYAELSNNFKDNFKKLFKFNGRTKTWIGKSPYLANKEAIDNLLGEIGLSFKNDISMETLIKNVINDFDLDTNNIDLLTNYIAMKGNKETNSNDIINVWEKSGKKRLYINNSNNKSIGYYSLDKDNNIQEFVEGRDNADKKSVDYYKNLANEIREKQGLVAQGEGESKDEHTRGNFTKQPNRDAHRDLSTDEKEKYGRINITRGRAVKKSQEIVLPGNILEVLRQHQIDGTQSAIYSMDNYGGFILADGTGAGKTMQELAVLNHYKQKGNSVIIVTEKQIIPNFKEQAELLGINIELLDNKVGKLSKDKNTITITTYSSLKKLKDRADYIVFDESHNLKNHSSKKTKVGKSFADEAKGVMYASATPIDKTTQIQYLKETGVFDNTSFSKTMGALGYQYVEKNIGRRTVGAWERYVPQADAKQRLEDYFTELGNLGMLIKREVRLDSLSVNVAETKLNKKVHGAIEKVGLEYGNNEAIRLMSRRRYLEPYKMDKTVEVIDKKLAEGRKVVVFMDRVNDITDKEGEVASRGTIQLLEERLKAKDIKTAAIYGAKSSAKAIKDFNEGDARVAILTPQKGGAGISLDDTIGDNPRSMIIVTPPFSAMDNVQMVGRIVRLNTKSDSDLTYILSDSYIDMWNFDIIAKKLSTLEAMVQGDIKDILADVDNVGFGDRELPSIIAENRDETTLLDNYNYRDSSGSENLIESNRRIVEEKALNRETNTYMDNQTSLFDKTMEIPLQYVLDNIQGGYNNEHLHLDSKYSKKKILSIQDDMNLKGNVEEPIVIGVDYKGNAFVLKGYYELQAAKNLNIEKIPIKLKYFDGGESSDKSFSPTNIIKQLMESKEKTKERLKEVDSVSTTKELKVDKELYKRARGNMSSALRLVDKFVDNDTINDLKDYKNAKIIPIIDKDNQSNFIPKAFVLTVSERTGIPIYTEIVKSNQHRGMKLSAIERMIEKPNFKGIVEKGQTYVIVDDILTKGSTVKKLIEYIHKKGGKVARVVTLSNSDSKTLMVTEETLNEINNKLGVENIEKILIQSGAINENIEELTEGELKEIQKFENLDIARNEILEGRLGQRDSEGQENLQPDAETQEEYGQLGKQKLHTYMEYLANNDKKELKNFHEIITGLSRHFKVPVTTLSFRKRKFAGFYTPIPRTIHMKYADDIRTALHEFGHHIDHKYDLQNNHSEVVEKLIDIILPQRFLDSYSATELPGEAVAEFFNYYITNPSLLQEMQDKDVSNSIKDFREIVETELSKVDSDKLDEARKDISRIYDKGVQGVMGSQMISYTRKYKDMSIKDKARLNAKRLHIFLFEENQQLKDLAEYTKNVTGKELKPSENPYRMMMNLTSSSQRAAAIIGMFDTERGTPIESLGPKLKAFHTKSFSQVLNPVIANKQEFDLYLKNVRAIDLMGKDHKVFPNEISISDVQEAVKSTEEAYPNFKETAEELYGWWDDFMMAWLVEPGYLDKQVWAKMKTEDPHYVPLFRVDRKYSMTATGEKIYSSSGSVADMKSPLKKLSYKGSADATYSPTESMVIQIMKIVESGMKREVMVSIDKLAKKNIPGMGLFFSKTAAPMKRNTFDASEMKMDLAMKFLMDHVKNEYDLDEKGQVEVRTAIFGDEAERNKALRTLEDLGADRNSLEAFTLEIREIMKDTRVDQQETYSKLYSLLGKKGYSAAPITDFLIQDIVEWYTPQSISKENNVVSVIDEDNNTVFYEIHDQLLLNALIGMSPKQVDGAMQGAIKVKRTMTNLITSGNPFFGLLSNLPRDIQTAIVYGHENNPAKYAASYGASLKSVATNDAKNRSFKAIGGGFGYSVSGSQRDIVKEVYNKMGVKNANIFLRATMWFEKFNDAIETAPRQVEFYKILNEKLADGWSEYDALLEALYESRDVTLNFMKKGGIMRIPIFKTIMFFNAGLQGLDKLHRAYTNPETRAATIAKSLFYLALPTIILTNIYRDDEDYKRLRQGIKDNYWLIKKEWFSNDPDVKGQFYRIPKPRELAFIFSTLPERIGDYMEGDEDAFYDLDTTFKNVFIPPLKSILGPLYDVAANKNWFGIPTVPMRLKNLPVDLQYDEDTSRLAVLMAKLIPDALGPFSSPKNIDYIIDQYTGIIGDIVLPLTTPSESAVEELFFRRTTSDVAYSNDRTQQFYDALVKLETAHYAFTQKEILTEDYDERAYEYFKERNGKLNESWAYIRAVDSSDEYTREEKSKIIRDERLAILEFVDKAVNEYRAYEKRKLNK